jgi:hypothetical protein
MLPEVFVPVPLLHSDLPFASHNAAPTGAGTTFVQVSVTIKLPGRRLLLLTMMAMTFLSCIVLIEWQIVAARGPASDARKESRRHLHGQDEQPTRDECCCVRVA